MRKIWYDLVARKLVRDLEESRLRLELRGQGIARLELLVRSLHDDIASLKTTNKALEKRLETSDPLARSIDHASRNASQQRIRDLEKQLRKNNIEPQ